MIHYIKFNLFVSFICDDRAVCGTVFDITGDGLSSLIIVQSRLEGSGRYRFAVYT